MDYFAICSKHYCDYSTPIHSDTADTIYGFIYVPELQGDDSDIESLHEVTVKKPLQAEKIEKYLPDDRFCEKCGAPLHFYCPHCKMNLFSIPDVEYCKCCGKKIK